MKRKVRPRPEQDKVVALLVNSPMPWTPRMISAELGWRSNKVRSIIDCAVHNCRLWRIERGMYTNGAHRQPEKPLAFKVTHRDVPLLSDDVIARYTGLNL